MVNKRYELTIGIISLSENVNSRDFQNPRQLDSLVEVETVLREWDETYRQIGHKVWSPILKEMRNGKYVDISREREGQEILSPYQ